jgi:hypothetical protein
MGEGEGTSHMNNVELKYDPQPEKHHMQREE